MRSYVRASERACACRNTISANLRSPDVSGQRTKKGCRCVHQCRYGQVLGVIRLSYKLDNVVVNLGHNIYDHDESSSTVFTAVRPFFESDKTGRFQQKKKKKKRPPYPAKLVYVRHLFVARLKFKRLFRFGPTLAIRILNKTYKPSPLFFLSFFLFPCPGSTDIFPLLFCYRPN